MSSPFRKALDRLGVPSDLSRLAGASGTDWLTGSGPGLAVHSPIDRSPLGILGTIRSPDLRQVIEGSREAFLAWRLVPAPRRGELIRRFGELCREHREDLAAVITWEVGKIRGEAVGEVQEVIDICEFAVGLSRQLHGLTIATERPGHRLMEQWHPLGPVGVITAFNFPMAVWGWNAVLGLVCGDPILWKPSEKAPLSAVALHTVLGLALESFPDIPRAVSQLVLTADRGLAREMAESPALPLISATGSVPMGRDVAQKVAARLGRSLLELGGNNAMIVAPSADLELTIRSIAFAAAGTCGQRCTTLRRAIIHDSVYDDLVGRLKGVFGRLPVGDPTRAEVLVGPLIDEAAFRGMQGALDAARQEGGMVHGGEQIYDGVPAGGFYVRPALVEISAEAPIVQQETFAPILYLMRYRELGEAIAVQNGVPQGLSSSIMTNDLREAERFLSAAGSDCGIANVNMGTSGAEIGAAFGGEKETGGGRESGSDAWKNYMRRTTNSINYSRDLPLAQGIRFDVTPDGT